MGIQHQERWDLQGKISSVNWDTAKFQELTIETISLQLPIM